MALNPNHTFEDLGEQKCSIVEKNCTPERSGFLKKLLEHNGFEVVVLKSPPPKAAKPAAPKPPVATDESGTGETTPAALTVEETIVAPETYTVGVTDLTFSPINGVLNRELLTPSGAVVTMAYWKQQESTPQKDDWYWKK